MLLYLGRERPLDEIRKAMTYGRHEERCFYHFLSKFDVFEGIDWNTNLIRMAVQDVCNQLAIEGIDYCFLDFSINKYVNYGWNPVEVIKLIHSYFEYFRPGGVGLVLSLTYESPKARQEEYASLILNDEIASILVGIDLVGDEACFCSDFYKTILTPWRSRDLMVRAHVGESRSAENIKLAIEDLEVTNVAHGIKLFEDPALARLALERDIAFDLALTSNYLTGVWRDESHHPMIDMLSAGLCVTIGSDDPVVCNTTLTQEYDVAIRLGAGPLCPTLSANAYDQAKRWGRLDNSMPKDGNLQRK